MVGSDNGSAFPCVLYVTGFGIDGSMGGDAGVYFLCGEDVEELFEVS